MLAKSKGWRPSVLSVDIHKLCVEKSLQIQKQYLQESSSDIKFEVRDIDGRDNKMLTEASYGVIHCGFFVAEALHNRLLGALADEGLGLWPISDSNEQRLHVFKKENGKINKTYLISTLFSEQRKLVSEETQKYFVEYDNILNEPYEPPKPAPIRPTNPKTL